MDHMVQHKVGVSTLYSLISPLSLPCNPMIQSPSERCPWRETSEKGEISRPLPCRLALTGKLTHRLMDRHEECRFDLPERPVVSLVSHGVYANPGGMPSGMPLPQASRGRPKWEMQV